MKKGVMFLLVLALLFSFGCQKQEDFTEYENLTKELGEKILQGDPSVIEGRLSEKVLQQVSEEDLKTALLNLLQTERLVEIESVQATAQQGMVVTELKAKMTSTQSLLTIAYNKEKQIEGIFYRVLSRDVSSVEPEQDERPIKVGEDGALDGFLKIPKTTDGSKPPLVIFLHGSGAHDRDERIFENTPFRDIAEDLAAAGIASLRYDKRGFAKPESVNQEITIYEESLDDLYWILKNLDKFEGVDTSKVYVLGHSLGGTLLPKIASDHPELKGLIMMAGSARSLVDIWYDQALAVVKEEEKAEIEALYEKMKKQQENGIFPVKYLKSLEEVQASKYLPDLSVPMLVLQGEADFQVFYEKDFKELKEQLKDKKNVTFLSYPRLNHLFMKDNGMKSIDAYKEKGRVEKQVTEDILRWIKEH